MSNFKIVVIVTDDEIIVFKNNVRYNSFPLGSYKIYQIADFYGVKYSEILYL